MRKRTIVLCSVALADTYLISSETLIAERLRFARNLNATEVWGE
jgi:hypothetical protein